jgi:hypothetical protein
MEVGGGGASGGRGREVRGEGASASKYSGDCEGSGDSEDRRSIIAMKLYRGVHQLPVEL